MTEPGIRAKTGFEGSGPEEGAAEDGRKRFVVHVHQASKPVHMQEILQYRSKRDMMQHREMTCKEGLANGGGGRKPAKGSSTGQSRDILPTRRPERPDIRIIDWTPRGFCLPLRWPVPRPHQSSCVPICPIFQEIGSLSLPPRIPPVPFATSGLW
jgi:hypothetical protein